MKLYREGGFLTLSRAQDSARNLKLFCKGQYRLAVYPCTQCNSQLWQGAKEESDVEIFQKLVISFKSWKYSALHAPFARNWNWQGADEVPNLYLVIFTLKMWLLCNLSPIKRDRKMLTQANLTVPRYFSFTDTLSKSVLYF